MADQASGYGKLIKDFLENGIREKGEGIRGEGRGDK